MAEAENPVEGDEEAPKKKSRKGLLIGVMLALLLGGGGFFAVYAGMILKPESEAGTAEFVPEEEVVTLPPVAFVEIDPLVISLGNGSGSRHLRFRASLEVEPQFREDVTRLIPRVLDVLNSYLRAVEMRDIEDPSALLMLRAQMLRRIQLVTGEGRVRDLLIMEFVLN
ncbi:flagellar basal body-associated FliL family protein [Aliiroseovarius sp.]|uniref:flagellar basal body-associated FliL family protein n=1 Tax=Aliiroseovarius sp. TaxID=1872442 RepID=UPI002616F51A|nr:flagellar basal body-associated FliL family protein [Aliiroseovarius sp.]